MIVIICGSVGLMVAWLAYTTGKSVGFSDGLFARYPDMEKDCGHKLNPHDWLKAYQWGTYSGGAIMAQVCEKCGKMEMWKVYAE